MDERMTLEQVRIVLAGHVADDDRMTMATQRLLLQAIDAHLAQPAQAVDVGTLVEAIASEWDGCEYEGVGERIDIGAAIRQKVRAIGNAQAEGWTRAGPLNVQRWKGIDSMINTDFDYASDLPDGTYQLFTPTPPTKATPNAHE